jgi:hypothetical protein
MNSIIFYWIIIATCISVTFLTFSLLIVVLDKELRKKKRKKVDKIIDIIINSYELREAIITEVESEIKRQKENE